MSGRIWIGDPEVARKNYADLVRYNSTAKYAKSYEEASDSTDTSEPIPTARLAEIG